MSSIGADVLVQALAHEGIDLIFGIPGGVAIPIFDRLYDGPVRYVLCRHEQGAAHMADGYARSSGKVGACIATSGPGATNLITGLATAYMDSTPMLAITAQVRASLIGTDAFQEADIFGASLPVVKHSWLVKTPEEIAQTIHDAVYVATSGRPGPVLVDIPVNVSTGPCNFRPATDHDLAGYRPTVRGNAKQIKNAALLISQAQRPLLYLGGGVISAGAADLARQLAEKANLPVFTTLLGKGAIPETHPLCLGMAGMHGTAYANYAINEADLIVAIGARFDDRVTGNVQKWAPRARFIHIDVDPAEIGKVVNPTVPIVGDARSALEDLVPAVQPRVADAWNARCDEWKRAYPITAPAREDDLLSPQRVIEMLYRATRGNATFVTDVGQHQMWAAQFCLVDRPRRWLTSGGLGTMGYGLPAAVGAQIADLSETVIAIVGDGGLQMTFQELAVAVKEGANVIVACMNNGYLGMVRQWQEMFWNRRYSAVDLAGLPDFVKLAEAYGCEGIRATTVSEAEAAITHALERRTGPILLDFRTVREENVFPMIPAGGSVEDMRLG